MQIRHLIGLVVAGALAMIGTGCSATPSTAEASADPTGIVHETLDILGTGYSYDVPRHWGAPKQDMPGFDPDSMAIARRDRDGFTDNVNVLLVPGGPMTPQQARAAATRELRAFGARRVSARGLVNVDGVVSPHVRALMSLNNTRYTIDHFYLSTDDQNFVVTFSFSRGVRPATRVRVTDTVLGSWRWAR